MKKKYENVIWNMYDNMRQVPFAISSGAAQTSTALSYVSAYKDMETCLQFFLIILECIKNIESLTNGIKYYKHDNEEIQYAIDYNTDRMERNLKDFNSFIERRKAENWR